MDTIIAVDIGGTSIRCALYPHNSNSHITIKKIRTQGNQGKPEKPIDRLISCIEDIWPDQGRVLGICAAAPGSVAVKEGMVILAPNIPGWKNIPLGKILENHFSVKTFINNDARLAAYGEWKKGSGIGHTNLLYFTISTGIGGGIIVDGKLLQGEIGIATEVGHMTLFDEGPLCGCGHPGHLEAFSSGTAIQNFVRDEIIEGKNSRGFYMNRIPNSEEIAEAALAGDPLAKEAFNRAGYYLGIGIANYLHIFNPSCIIFGGGVTQSGSLIFEPFSASLEKHVLNKQYLENLTITTAKLGDNAGLIGCIEYLRDILL